MPISPKTSGVHHLAIRSSNLALSKAFYVDLLGFTAVLDTKSALVFLASSTVIGVLAPDADTAELGSFSSSRTGLDHIALGCDDVNEIARVATELSAAGVPNTGIKDDPATGKQYVAFYDPDNVAWELYQV